jgi:xanthine/uracil permease
MWIVGSGLATLAQILETATNRSKSDSTLLWQIEAVAPFGRMVKEWTEKSDFHERSRNRIEFTYSRLLSIESRTSASELYEVMEPLAWE